MRLRRASLVSAVTIWAGFGTWLAQPALSDTLVSRGGGVSDVYALGTTVVFRRDGSWKRIVDGRPVAARGVPQDSAASSIGHDRRGRVVVTFMRSTGVRAPFY